MRWPARFVGGLLTLLVSALFLVPTSPAVAVNITYGAVGTLYNDSSPSTQVSSAVLSPRGQSMEPSARSAGAPVSALFFGVAANAGARALPSALSGGAADTYVYFGAKNGKNVYVGITNNLGRRQAEHGPRFALDPITSAPVTRGQPRAIEQALIVRNPGFQNVRNSISPNHAYYDDAVSWSESWLKQNGP